MDERRDPGEFYPGGRVIGRDGVAPGQILVNWSDIQGKPETMPPSAHTHAQGDVEGLANALAARPTKAQMDDGWWSEWTCDPADYNGQPIRVVAEGLYDPVTDTWIQEGWRLYAGGTVISITKGDVNSAEVSWSSEEAELACTATRHRVAAPVPTKASDIGAASLLELYAAVRNLAPDFTAKTYTLNELCTYNGVFYRCKSAYTATSSSAKPDADTTHWEVKRVSELFLSLTGGVLHDAHLSSNLKVGDGNIRNDADNPLIEMGGHSADFGAIINAANGLSAAYAKPSAIAPVYSASSAYSVGDVVTHEGKRYVCSTAIAVGETWTLAHWTEESVQDVFDAIEEALDDIIANAAVVPPVSVDLYARALDTGKYHKVTVAKENGAVVGLEVDDVEVTR